MSETIFINITKSDKNTPYTYFFHRNPIMHLAVEKQKANGRGTPSSFVARFGQSKVRAVGLISSGVEKTQCESLERRKKTS